MKSVVLYCVLALIASVLLSCAERKFDNPVDPQIHLLAPNKLQVALTSDTSAVLQWSDPNSFDEQEKKEAHYEVFGVAADSAYSLIRSIGADSTMASLPGTFMLGSTYKYCVRVVIADKVSPFSDPIIGVLSFPAPSNLAIASMTDVAVSIQWTRTSSFVRGYDVELSDDRLNFRNVATIDRDTTAATLSGRFLATSVYSFRIRARSKFNLSEYSNVVISPIAPVADFVAAPTLGVAPLAVQFTETSSGTVATSSWSFGDNQSSTLQNPSHTYQNAGSYSVTLTASGPRGNDTKSRANYISVSPPIPAPLADFVASPLSGVVPLTVQFTDLSTGSITGRQWSFGDGSTSSMQNPTHTYTASGSWTIQLTAAGPGGTDTKTKTNYILVTDAPVVVYAGLNGGGVYKSTNTGQSWQALNSGLTNTSVQCLAITPSGLMFVGMQTGYIYRSTDNGASWNTVNNGLAYGITALAVNSSGHIFAANRDIFRSTDNGNNWDLVRSTSGVQCLAVNAQGHIFAGTRYDGVQRSLDNGSTWKLINNGVPNAGYILSLAINSSGHIFAGADGGNGIFRSTDNGDSWIAVNNGLTSPWIVNVFSLAASKSGSIFAGIFKVIFRSSDNGGTWTVVDNNLNYAVAALSAGTSSLVLAGTDGEGVFRSTDNGATWAASNNGLPANSSVTSIVIR